MAVITLITDFGLQDEFVGVMHGVILGIAPSARIVDLCHVIPPGDRQRAAYRVAWAFRYFPRGTIHVVVVDPGVGTSRRLLCATAHGHRFVGPDNGVLTLVLQRTRAVVHAVREPRYWLPAVSPTFHGRDILAPVAAHLARGVIPRRLGPATRRWVELPLPGVRRQGRGWRATVVDIDHFGNLVTNLEIQALGASGRGLGSVTVRVRRRVLQGIQRTYQAVRPGELAAVVGSRGTIEIAARDGHAAHHLAARVGDPVMVEHR